MEEERVVSAERGRQLAEQLGVEFYETSAKENINVKVCLNFFDSSFCFVFGRRVSEVNLFAFPSMF